MQSLAPPAAHSVDDTPLRLSPPVVEGGGEGEAEGEGEGGGEREGKEEGKGEGKCACKG